MPTKNKKAARRNFKAAPELLYLMCRKSQTMHSASDWLRIAAKRRNRDLREALTAYAPDVGDSPIAMGFALKALAGQRLGFDGNQLELIERFFPGDNARRYGVRSPLREKILKQRAAFQRRDAAHQLKLGEAPLPIAPEPAAPPVAPESAADRSHREALEETRAAGWFTPLARSTRPAPEPAYVEPAPAPAPVVDTTGWPPAWRKFGKPNYLTRTHEAPDESFRNHQAGTSPAAEELGNFKAADNEYPRSPLPK